MSPRRGCKRHGTPTIAEPVPDHRFSATSTGSSIVLLDDALASMEGSRECFRLSVAPALFQFHTLYNILRRLIDLKVVN